MPLAFMPIHANSREDVDSMIQYIIENKDFSDTMYRRCLNRISSTNLWIYFNERYRHIHKKAMDGERLTDVVDKKKRQNKLSKNLASFQITNKQSIDLLIDMLIESNRFDSMKKQFLDKIRVPELRAYYTKKCSLVELTKRPSPELKEVKTPRSTKHSPVLMLKWENVQFHNGYYVFTPKAHYENTPIPLKVKEPFCLQSFNYITQYFQQRLPKIRYQIYKNGDIKILDTIKFQNAILMIAQEHKQATIEKRAFNPDTKKSNPTNTLQAAIFRGQQMTLADFRKYKSLFIDFLVSKQNRKYKIVPMTEGLDHTTSSHGEDAFLFTVHVSSEQVNIILENVNPARSTIIFTVLQNEYMKALNTIYTFMQGDTVNKRSEIRCHAYNMKPYGIVRYRSINHDSYSSWRLDVMQK